ncbi:MAG TPA: fatty acid--CoA ligase family protein [Stellaceae bacterium]|nr:fatty acid--CoA ligase family protein [Stellaceae bacterium]
MLTKHQLPSALALIELDGVARRVVVCPLDLQPEHLPSIMETAKIDTVVGDRCLGVSRFVPCSTQITPAHRVRRCCQRTEWVLMTSGTTGVPKLVAHTLCSLSTAMTGRDPLGAGAVWSTFYDMRRYGGLQIFLRAMLGGGSMVLSSAEEPVGDFLTRAGRHGVTHISGTPSHWRRTLMSSHADKMAPRYMRMSGEIADQAVLDHLRSAFPDADIAHAFASTEAGVAFAVGDGLAGFPAEYLGRRGAVDLRVVDGSLRIKSGGNALGYLGDDAPALLDAEGFVDTGDMVEPRDGRYFFVGRRGGVINIGGQKVHPEEVEAAINSHPGVRMSLVKARHNPITGAIVVAEVVVKSPSEAPEMEALKGEILEQCRTALARHKVPATIRFVPAIEVGASGKIARHA